MEMKNSSSISYKCDFCNEGISMLTKKLQQHPTSQLWLKHGQCCAVCTAATKNITGIKKEVITRQDHNKSSRESISKSGDHNTNIILALNRASEIEEEAEFKIRRRAQRSITTGKTIASIGLAAGFIFFYYEYFTVALIGLITFIGGIVLCRLGVWKKCRTR